MLWYIHHHVGKNTQPDGNFRGLRQSVPSLQSSVDLSHLHGSFQPHHLQTFIAHIWREIGHTDTRWNSLKPTILMRWFMRVQNQPSLTLWDRFEKFRVSDDLTMLRLCHTVRLLGFAPEVGASVYAGYVEDSDALQRQTAQVQVSPTALAKAKQQVVLCLHHWRKTKFRTWTANY